jgi:hypothetical protein
MHFLPQFYLLHDRQLPGDLVAFIVSENGVFHTVRSAVQNVQHVLNRYITSQLSTTIKTNLAVSFNQTDYFCQPSHASLPVRHIDAPLKI